MRTLVEARTAARHLIMVVRGVEAYEDQAAKTTAALDVLAARCRAAVDAGSTIAELAEVTGIEEARIRDWL